MRGPFSNSNRQGQKLETAGHRVPTIVQVVAIVMGVSGVVFAQASAEPSLLSVRQAAQIALEKNPLHKAALAETKAASAGVREAQAGLMPHISFSETAARGNDPVYIFGSKLRQQRFTADNFAPPLNKLNTPLPYGNFTTRFGGTWNLFDSFATWHEVSRAQEMKTAAAQQLERTDQELLYRVVQSYYGVLLAAKQVEVAEHSEKTAKAIMDSSQVRYDAGVVVESDLLSAKVRLASRQQERVRAKNNLEIARAQLNTAMGILIDAQYQLADPLEQTAPVAATVSELEQKAIANRPDLKRIEAQQSAQDLSVAIAKSSFGPRLNAFAGWEMDNPTFLAGGGGNNWLGGIELQIDIFQGGAKHAALSRERAVAEKMAALKQAAQSAARLEVRQAYYEQDSNRQHVEVARAAIAQAQEGLRIIQDRYDGGLLTITELLNAEETAHRSQADYWLAVYQFQVSYANLELACGTLNLQSPVITP